MTTLPQKHAGVGAALCLFVTLLIAGCGGGSEPESEATTQESSNPGTSSNDGETMTGGETSNAGGEEPAQSEPEKQTAVNITKSVADGIDNSRPEAFFERLQLAAQKRDLAIMYRGLPPVMRSDVDGLIKQFAVSMGPKTWDPFMQSLARLGRIMETRQSMILKSPLFLQLLRQTNPEGTAEESLERWSSLVNRLTSSQLATVQSAQNLDVEAFIESSGNSLLETFFEMEPRAARDFLMYADEETFQWEPVSQSGEAATVEVMTGPNGRYREEVTMIVVDGYWIPRGVADEWETAIAEISDSMFNANFFAVRDIIQQGTPILNEGLAEMEKAADPEGLQNGVLGTMQKLEPVLEGVLSSRQVDDIPLGAGGGGTRRAFNALQQSAKQRRMGEVFGTGNRERDFEEGDEFDGDASDSFPESGTLDLPSEEDAPDTFLPEDAIDR